MRIIVCLIIMDEITFYMNRFVSGFILVDGLFKKMIFGLLMSDNVIESLCLLFLLYVLVCLLVYKVKFICCSRFFVMRGIIFVGISRMAA